MEATDTSNPTLNYGLVVDCGSSGSRVFVYCWPRHNGNPHELLDIRQMRDQHRKPVVMKIKPGKSYTHLYFGRLADSFNQSDNKYIFQKKEKQYIAVGTVRMFIEPSAKHYQLLGLPIPVCNKDG